MSECCWIFFNQHKATFPHTTVVSVAYVDCYTLSTFHWNWVSRLKTGKSLDWRSQMCWLLCLKGMMSIKMQWFQYFCEFVVDIKETVEILHARVKTRLLTSVILAVIKQFYQRFSPPVHLSVRPSICLSVCHTFLTMYLSSHRHDIFRSDYHWQEKGCTQGLFLPANFARFSHFYGRCRIQFTQMEHFVACLTMTGKYNDLIVSINPRCLTNVDKLSHCISWLR